MTEVTWILDPSSGHLVVEGVTAEEAAALAGDLLQTARDLNCARPLHWATAPLATPADTSGAMLRVARIYHGSVVEGPGRRSVVQLQGCPIKCRGCFVPETHDPDGGTALSVAQVVDTLLDPAGEPRDGITMLGGEPMAQPKGLLALLSALKALNLHIVVYTGYTLDALGRRPELEIRKALLLTDLLIDGPFVATQAYDAGEWRGSRNQRLIYQPGVVLAHRQRRGRGA
ncbi:MAG: radical SAM protein [Chloroflexi bacterium]|nr:radical SAM protein [Chloroflexota bacterium]